MTRTPQRTQRTAANMDPRAMSDDIRMATSPAFVPDIRLYGWTLMALCSVCSLYQDGSPVKLEVLRSFEGAARTCRVHAPVSANMVDTQLHIESVTAPTDDVRSLIGELEVVLAAEYPPEQRHALSLSALFLPHIRFFLARLLDASTGLPGEAVGCGGVALFSDFAEVKRMYVRPQHRGRGVADALLARIESTAREATLGRICLETGDRQAAAIRVYGRAGFSRCAAFGDYAKMDPHAIATSVFMEKRFHV